MSLFGPDGQPLRTGRIIGGPKDLTDFPLLHERTIDEMYDGMNQLIANGQPLEVPAAMPMAQLASLARTLKHFHVRVKELEAKLAEATKGEEVKTGPGVLPLPFDLLGGPENQTSLPFSDDVGEPTVS